MYHVSYDTNSSILSKKQIEIHYKTWKVYILTLFIHIITPKCTYRKPTIKRQKLRVSQKTHHNFCIAIPYTKVFVWFQKVIHGGIRFFPSSDAITLPLFEQIISGKTALNTGELCLTKKVVF